MPLINSKLTLAQIVSLKHDLLLRGVYSNSVVLESDAVHDAVLELDEGLFVRTRIVFDAKATPYHLSQKKGAYHVGFQNRRHELLSAKFMERTSKEVDCERGLIFQRNEMVHLPYLLMAKRPESHEAVDLCVRMQPDLVCFELGQLAAPGQTRIQVEQTEADVLKILRYATDVFPKSSVCAVISVNPRKIEPSKTDMEVLSRMEILPLLSLRICETENYQDDDLHCLEELSVYAYKICVTNGLNLSLLRQLSTVIHPAEGKYLEQNLSCIKRTMLQLNRTDLFSRRKARSA